MKCPNCGQQNKEEIIKCKKCGLDLTIPDFWEPDLKWHLKTLGVIFLGLTIIYIILNVLFC